MDTAFWLTRVNTGILTIMYLKLFIILSVRCIHLTGGMIRKGSEGLRYKNLTRIHLQQNLHFWTKVLCFHLRCQTSFLTQHSSIYWKKKVKKNSRWANKVKGIWFNLPLLRANMLLWRDCKCGRGTYVHVDCASQSMFAAGKQSPLSLFFLSTAVRMHVHTMGSSTLLYEDMSQQMENHIPAVTSETLNRMPGQPFNKKWISTHWKRGQRLCVVPRQKLEIKVSTPPQKLLGLSWTPNHGFEWFCFVGSQQILTEPAAT